MLADRVRMGGKTDDGMIEIKAYATYSYKPENSRIAFFPIIKEFETWDELRNNYSIYLGDPVDVTDATYANPINVKTLATDKVIWGITTGWTTMRTFYLNGAQINSKLGIPSILLNYVGFSELRPWQSPTDMPLIKGDIVGVHMSYD